MRIKCREEDLCGETFEKTEEMIKHHVAQILARGYSILTNSAEVGNGPERKCILCSHSWVASYAQSSSL